MQNATIQHFTVYIKSTRFLTKREVQLGPVVIFSPYLYVQWLILFHVDNVIISALAYHIPIPSFSPLYICDGTTKLQHPSNINVSSDFVKNDYHKQISLETKAQQYVLKIRSSTSPTALFLAILMEHSSALLIFSERLHLRKCWPQWKLTNYRAKRCKSSQYTQFHVCKQ